MVIRATSKMKKIRSNNGQFGNECILTCFYI